MRVVAALGGNALLQRGEALTAENQRRNVRQAAHNLAPLAREHQLVISHGNGPQVGLLALQGSAYAEVEVYPLDILDAETEGMIGYVLQQELGNELPFEVPVVTLLTQIEVDPRDHAFGDPTKPIGPVYTSEQAEQLAATKGWAFKPDGESMRRVVASPAPRRIFGLAPIEWMLDRGAVVVCAGGGGIPVAYLEEAVPAGRRLVGVEAVIDKDLASAMLAGDIGADVLAIVTDVEAVYLDYGTPRQRAIRRAGPAAIAALEFAAGSMAPKVAAACAFVERTGGTAVIGSIADAARLVSGEAGTIVTPDARDVELAAA
ncbi:MAG TPA: carbamate kinase [Solirubrobacteraceae bacterium]|nr:carbamate kinase [Solirubrobacteraceae bacterium]